MLKSHYGPGVTAMSRGQVSAALEPFESSTPTTMRSWPEHLSTVGDEHRGIGQHPAPVVYRAEPATGQRPRQPRGQATAIGQQPQRRGPGVIDHITTGDFNVQVLRP